MALSAVGSTNTPPGLAQKLKAEVNNQLSPSGIVTCKNLPLLSSFWPGYLIVLLDCSINYEFTACHTTSAESSFDEDSLYHYWLITIVNLITYFRL